MDLPLTRPEDIAFRDEVRTFLDRRLPDDLRAKGAVLAECTRDEVIRWFKLLSEQGWIAPSWPTTVGGAGWSLLQRLIFDVECGRAGAPRYTNMGVSYIGPVVMHYGTPEQKRRFLPPILASDVLWAQGYSEPGAGSDLASLQTRAVRDGDAYVVNGSKIWTTMAHWADWIFALVRTSTEGRKQQGISFLLIDMKSPGIRVRPLPRISGVHEFNQVFFDDVRVPVDNRIGPENGGWTIAKYLLGHERITTGAGVGALARFLDLTKRIATEESDGDGPLIENPAFRRRLAALEIEAETVIAETMRILASADADTELGYESSRLKVYSSRVQYDLAELLSESVGWYAIPHHHRALHEGWGNEAPVGPAAAVGLVPNYFDWRKIRIGGGGSDEISREIIAKQTLGL